MARWHPEVLCPASAQLHPAGGAAPAAETLMSIVFLRELDESDWPALQACLGDAETVRYTESDPFTEASARWLVSWAREKKREEPRTAFVFGVMLSPDTPVVGAATLTIRNLALSEADVGVVIGREQWGHGCGTAAVRQMLALGFDTLGLHRITGECHPGNLASGRVLEKAGLVREGCLREHRRQKGRWVDRLLYAVLDRDWVSLAPLPAG